MNTRWSVAEPGELMLWQFKSKMKEQKVEKTAEGLVFLTTVHPTAYDSQKGRQNATLEARLIWALGRRLLANSKNPNTVQFELPISEFGQALADSEFVNRQHESPRS